MTAETITLVNALATALLFVVTWRASVRQKTHK